MVVEDGGQISHVSLGLDAATVEHVAAIAAALESGHRAPLANVIEQVRALTHAV